MTPDRIRPSLDGRWLKRLSASRKKGTLFFKWDWARQSRDPSLVTCQLACPWKNEISFSKRPAGNSHISGTVDRNRIRKEYKQEAILIGNVNRVYVDSCGYVVRGEGLGRLLLEAMV